MLQRTFKLFAKLPAVCGFPDLFQFKEMYTEKAIKEYEIDDEENAYAKSIKDIRK